MGILLLTSKQDSVNLADLFKPGSLPKIAIFFILIAAVYPALGFAKRKLYLNGDIRKYRDIIVTSMENAGYTLYEDTSDHFVFRHKKGFVRLTRMYEDKITFSVLENPVLVEGFRKDVERVIRTIEFRIRQEDEQQQ